MLKKLFTLMGLFTVMLFGQTYVSGVINGETWTAENSPYILEDNLTIYSLQIGPGVEVLGTPAFTAQ